MALGTITLSSLILLFAYPFVIYPLLLAGWSRRKQRRDESAAVGSEPRVALIICALNEQNRDEVVLRINPALGSECAAVAVSSFQMSG